jgi:hypothetical protein
MIEAPTQKQVTDVTGYTPANPQAAQFMTPEQVKGLHLDDVDNYQRHIYFWQRATTCQVRRNLERSESGAVVVELRQPDPRCGGGMPARQPPGGWRY